MGSKGRILPPHMKRPHPGPGLVHSEPFAPAVRPLPGGFPSFDMLPPPEIMEQRLAAQHVEMEKLATENQRLAATHGILRQQLAAAQQELQMLQAQVAAVNSERDQQMRGLMEKISKMEAELKAAEPVKLELQQAHAEAQGLVKARQELASKVQQLTQDLQKAHVDLQHMPALMVELDGLRQEYQHCRATYDYEKKLYNDHLVSLQVMEKNYITMADEVEKLRAELNNSASTERRSGYGGSMAYVDNDARGPRPLGANAYEDGFGVSQQGRGPLPGAHAAGGTSYHGGPQSGPASRPGHDVSRGLTFDAQRGSNYDAQGGPVYNAQRGPNYDMQRPPAYDAQRAAAVGYDVPRGASYDLQSRGGALPSGPTPSGSMPYGSATPPAQAGSGYEAPARAGNPDRR
ncbi:hypothetical protein Ancab_023269 [Ancistrocladus abbreviatus]